MSRPDSPDRYRTALDRIAALLAAGAFDFRTSWHTLDCLNTTRPCAACTEIDEILTGAGLDTIRQHHSRHTNGADS